MKFISVNGFVLENFQVGFVGVAGLEVHPVSVDLLVEFVGAVAPPVGVGRPVLLDFLVSLPVKHSHLQSSFVVQDRLVGFDLQCLLVAALRVRNKLVVTLAGLFLDFLAQVVVDVGVDTELVFFSVLQFGKLGLQCLNRASIPIFWNFYTELLVVI